MNAKLGLEALREPPKPALLALHMGEPEGLQVLPYLSIRWEPMDFPAYSDEAGRGFRSEAGRCSDVKPATIPI